MYSVHIGKLYKFDNTSFLIQHFMVKLHVILMFFPAPFYTPLGIFLNILMVVVLSKYYTHLKN